MSFLVNSSTLPPPLTESESVGKTELNYTALHQKLAEPIGCLKIPLGVLGFYVYVALHIVSGCSLYLAGRTGGKLYNCNRTERSQVGFISSCLTFAFSLLFLIDSCKTAHSCSLKHGHLGIANLMGIIWSSLSQLGALLGLLGSAPCFSADRRLTMWKLATFAYASSWFATLLPGLVLGFVLTFGIFHEGGVVQPGNANFFRWLDSVPLTATLVSAIPGILLAAATLVWGLLYYWQTADGAASTAKRTAKYGLTCVFYAFALLWTGTTYVSLGKIFGPPWGTSWVVEKTGKLYAARIAVFTFLLSMLSLGA
ncbi:hypothetical protein BDW02DRAFT_596922 [Decorospora gaudefroyi]|uniref:Uncharacterized protein n=1 Tax=Decorospora gaudefroyi TaxID=184978 RepID=A0A6A5KFG4_9PLEO|nr:hypothetical protein BDW02DRAFT_596922 [Decorospora gaudefroyi]